MSLAQVSEIIAMLCLGWWLMNWSLKWIFVFGLFFGVIRFILSACNTPELLLLGIGVHGLSFVPVFITAQVYLDQQIDPAWRSRAQALLILLNGGVGNLIGYLGNGWWFHACRQPGGTRWPLFWGGLAAVAAAVLVYFLLTYREQPSTGAGKNAGA